MFSNNLTIENLYLCKSNSNHQKLRKQMLDLVYEGYKLGIPIIIKFDKIQGNYYLKK